MSITRILKFAALTILLSVAFFTPISAQSELKQATIIHIAWSPVANEIAFADLTQDSQVWDVAAHKQLFQLEEGTGEINGPSWSPDGTKLATASNVTAHIWNAISGQLLTTISDGLDIMSLAWTPDSKQLLTGMDGVNISPPILRRWDTLSGALIYNGNAGALLIAFSPNGQLLILDPDVSVELRDTETFNFVAKLQKSNDFEQNYQTSAIAWSADSQTLAVGYVNGTIRIWDIKTRSILLEFKANESIFQNGQFIPTAVMNVAYNIDGTELYSVSADGTLRGWNVSTGHLLFDTRLNQQIWAAAWSPYKARLAIGLVDEGLAISFPKNEMYSTLANGRIVIITPAASLENLKNTAIACLSADQVAELNIKSLTKQHLKLFAQKIQLLANIPKSSACLVDMMALLQVLNNA